VKRLRQNGDEVVCLVRENSRREPLEALDARFVQGDVMDPDSLRRAVDGVDVVYHLAGVTKTFRLDEMDRVNVQGVKHIAEACAARTSPPVLVMISSLAAAGPAISGRPRRETDPAQPVSRYGISKRGGELAAFQRADDVPITIVRPPIVFGEGDRDVYRMFRPIHRFGLHVLPRVGRTDLSLVYVDDLARGLILAAEKGRRLASPQASPAHDPRGIYFTAFEDTYSYDELGHLISCALGRPTVRIVPTPQAVSWLICMASEFTSRIRRKPAILNMDKAREIRAGSWTCNTKVAREELGFLPEATVSQRLEQTAQWYFEEGWLS
jgi:nucleoside-diphosphate-sugar epimerase